MQREDLRGILSEIEHGQLAVEDALAQLTGFPASADLGHTTLDTAREARCGHPEVVYGAGKTPKELLEVSRAVIEHHERLLVTRATDDGLALLRNELDEAVIHERSRCVTVGAASVYHVVRQLPLLRTLVLSGLSPYRVGASSDLRCDAMIACT